MGFAQRVLLGAIAGSTIHLGLPVARVRRFDDRLRTEGSPPFYNYDLQRGCSRKDVGCRREPRAALSGMVMRFGPATGLNFEDALPPG